MEHNKTMTNTTLYWGGAHTVPTAYNFGGGGAPSQSQTSKDNERLNNALLRKQLAEANNKKNNVEALKVPPAPVYAPAPTSTNQDAAAASDEARRQAIRRRGLMSTVVAGSNSTSTLGAK